MLGLALILVLSQPTVALVLANRTEIVAVRDAEREYRQLERLKHRNAEQVKRFAALVQALGVRPSNELLACANLDPARHQPLCETLRGRRVPLQRSGRQ